MLGSGAVDLLEITSQRTMRWKSSRFCALKSARTSLVNLEEFTRQKREDNQLKPSEQQAKARRIVQSSNREWEQFRGGDEPRHVPRNRNS
jgi:hypothetical protein